MISTRLVKALTHLNRLPEALRCCMIFECPGALLRSYLQIGKRAYPFMLATRNKQILEINSFHDAVTAWIIFCRKEYNLAASAKTIIDIGANFGAFSLWASRQAPHARLVAVEPFPDSYARLRRQIQNNNLCNRITPLNIGLGNYSHDRFLNEQTLSELGGPTQSRTFSGASDENPQSTKISMLSVDDLISKVCSLLGCDQIDFVKLDIEGDEHSAFTPGTTNALKRVRALGMEYHPNGSKAALFGLLSDAGFRCAVDIPVSRNSGVAHFIRISM